MPPDTSAPAQPVGGAPLGCPAEPFFDPGHFCTEAGLLWQLRRAQLAIGQLVSEATELGGPTVPQWVPLYQIHSGMANTVADLARKCTVDAGSMTRLLDRLEARGLCRRVRSATARRGVHIELTPEGVSAAEQMPRVLSHVYNAVLDGFAPEEWAQLQALLGRLTGNAERLVGQGVGQEVAS